MEQARKAMKPALKKRAEESGQPAPDYGDEKFITVFEDMKLDLEHLRKTFQRATGSPHGALDKLWISYEQFEKSFGNPPVATKILSEHMPRYVRGKTAFKELQTLAAGIDHFAVAVPLKAKTAAQHLKVLEKWRNLLHFERTNPLRLNREQLQARVSLIYQQAALSCAYHSELWHDFAGWLDQGGQRDQATELLRRAVERFLPQDLTLRLMVAHRWELGESPLPASKLEAADEEYKKLLEDMPKPCPLALVNYLAYVRRQRGAHEFREAFLEVTESSPHCTWEVYSFAAETEYHVFGSLEAAAAVYRLGLERYGERESSLLAAYVNFLIGVNDLKGARAELSRAVLNRLQVGLRDRLANREDPSIRNSLAFFWQKWVRLERYFGDSEAVRRAANFRDEEFRSLQRDQEVEEEAVLEAPIPLGLATTINEVEEGFRFHHLVPRTVRPVAAEPAQVPATSSSAPFDQVVSEAVDDNKRLGSVSSVGLSVHIARPDVSKMLTFKPAMDLGVSRAKRRAEQAGIPEGGQGKDADEGPAQLAVTIPKCLQDLLNILPAKPLKGAKPDVDYLLTVLQTVPIPPVPVRELEQFRYDSLRLLKEEEGDFRRRMVKEEVNGEGFFSSRPTAIRERLQAKRQKVIDENSGAAKPEG